MARPCRDSLTGSAAQEGIDPGNVDPHERQLKKAIRAETGVREAQVWFDPFHVCLGRANALEGLRTICPVPTAPTALTQPTRHRPHLPLLRRHPARPARPMIHPQRRGEAL